MLQAAVCAAQVMPNELPSCAGVAGAVAPRAQRTCGSGRGRANRLVRDASDRLCTADIRAAAICALRAIKADASVSLVPVTPHEHRQGGHQSDRGLEPACYRAGVDAWATLGR
jgi:hypothetical protein